MDTGKFLTNARPPKWFLTFVSNYHLEITQRQGDEMSWIQNETRKKVPLKQMGQTTRVPLTLFRDLFSFINLQTHFEHAASRVRGLIWLLGK